MKLSSYRREIRQIADESIRNFNYLVPYGVTFKLADVEENGKSRTTFFERSYYWSGTKQCDFDIFLGVKDIISYATANDVDIEYATRLILGHEIMHISLGHFGPKYKDYNKKLLNIAGDLEINTILDITHPAIIPEDFGLPRYLDTDSYYEMLKEQYENDKEEFEKNATKYKESLPEGVEEFDINNEMTDEQANGNLSINREVNFNKDNKYDKEEKREMTPQQIEVLSKKIKGSGSGDKKKDFYEVNSSIEGLNNILRKMMSNENTFEIIPTKKQPSYHKFNNRRKSDFILPGKKIVQSGSQKKFQKSLTVFVDVSGSTSTPEILHNLKVVSSKLHKVGATVVYYDDSIKDVLKPKELYCHYRPSGGTSISRVVKEYTDLGNKIERLYVFTDGADNFSEIPKLCDEYHIFRINKTDIRELTEKEIRRENPYY